MSDGLYEDMRRLLEGLYPEPHLRTRAPRAANYLFRLVGNGEPIGRLLAELVRASAPTIPPPRAAADSPIPETLDLTRKRTS